MENIAQRVIDGDRRAVARMITLIENNDPDKEAMMSYIYPYTGKAYVVGITGSPGAGKSTLTDELVHVIREKGLRVGVIAVDPSSPFTGGAILGDRIRMQGHSSDPGVFIRSMGSRGFLGGVSYATAETIKVLDAYGVDIVIVETVGVGQSEYEIMHHADTVVLVLTPGMGDAIQAIKAGIMEIADVFAVNKGDLPGADSVVHETNHMLDLGRRRERRPDIYLVSAIRRMGVDALWEGIMKHRHDQEVSGKFEEKREIRIREEIQDKVLADLRLFLKAQMANAELGEDIFQKVKNREMDPKAAAKTITKKVLDKWQEERNC